MFADRRGHRPSRTLKLGAPCVVAVAFAGVAIAAAPFALAQGPTARLIPAASTVAPDDAFTLTLRVTGMSDLAGFQAGIDWDEATVAFEGVTPSPWLGTTGRRVASVAPRVTRHTVDFVTYSLPPTPGEALPGVDGDGILATVRFKALAPGSTVIVFRQLLLANTENEPIAVDLSNAEIEIEVPPPPPSPRIFLPNAFRQR